MKTGSYPMTSAARRLRETMVRAGLVGCWRQKSDVVGIEVRGSGR